MFLSFTKQLSGDNEANSRSTRYVIPVLFNKGQIGAKKVKRVVNVTGQVERFVVQKLLIKNRLFLPTGKLKQTFKKKKKTDGANA